MVVKGAAGAGSQVAGWGSKTSLPLLLGRDEIDPHWTLEVTLRLPPIDIQRTARFMYSNKQAPIGKLLNIKN